MSEIGRLETLPSERSRFFYDKTRFAIPFGYFSLEHEAVAADQQRTVFLEHAREGDHFDRVGKVSDAQECHALAVFREDVLRRLDESSDDGLYAAKILFCMFDAVVALCEIVFVLVERMTGDVEPEEFFLVAETLSERHRRELFEPQVRCDTRPELSGGKERILSGWSVHVVSVHFEQGFQIMHQESSLA